MPKLNCYWAGQLVQSVEVAPELCQEKIEELKKQIKEGACTFVSCLVTHTLKELCVDVIHEDGTVDFVNIKHKE